MLTLTAAVLGGGNPALVYEPGGLERGELLLLPRRGVLRNRGVVFVEGFFILDKRCGDPRRRDVDAVGKDDPADFAGFRTGESDRQEGLEEHLPDVAEVVVLGQTDNRCKGRDSGLEFDGDVRY